MRRARLKRAELDWETAVEKMPLNQFYNEDFSKQYPSKCVIVSKDEQRRLFGVVSPSYCLVPHTQAISMLTSRLEDKFGEFPAGNLNILSLDYGASIKADFSLKGLVDPITVGNGEGDINHLNLSLFNSYDGRFPLKVTLGAFRLVCSNGMTIFTTWSTISARHFHSATRMEVFDSRLDVLLKNGLKLREVWEEWNNIQIGFDDPLVKAIYEKIPEKYVKRFGLKTRLPVSKWNLYNILTEMATHRVRRDKARLQYDQTISNLFYEKQEVM
jgi:hypothetical protein